ncbi:flagellar basal-body MS-ring/collar protein FliF [Salimicrobium halophilum]|uniref:Flagellar M-ring protein n=1 Tax=Salimicrobium halophilum TaxID=86666 RepID=A0A1G8QB45_9BACI|nr:flagellar basal-body MS-ring/collar protein FliF [Salimicrobium halophilum]SDJ01947.1 flagellar M-ring protein FliF [Salimicrobium halophilum]
MKEKLKNYQEKVTAYWRERSKGQKGIIIGSFIALLFIIVAVTVFSSRTNMVPLYQDLSRQEVGQVKAELDTRGVNYEITGGGSTIHVPESQAESLLVDLAAAGLPESGNIDYGFFSNNVSWGMTDNEFSMIKLDAMQSELATLMSSIDGINDAKVMINIPEEEVFVSDDKQPTSASIVVNTEPGYRLENGQVEALYNLASKSVPNLSNENIAIMDQNFQYYDPESSNNSMAGATDYTEQQTIKKQIERDIQQRVQRMLSAMVGPNKAITTVTADIDFTQENRREELVEPVDPEEMEGLPVSIERIEEAYSGGVPEGIAGAGDEDIQNYPADAEGAPSDYEMTEETINNEFNRIYRDIEESPFKIRDLGIQVAVDTVRGQNENGEPELLTEQEQQEVSDGIDSVLNSMINTSINTQYEENVNPDDSVSIIFQEFQGTPEFDDEATGLPTWVYIVGGLLLLVVAFLLWRLFRNGEEEEEYEYEEVTERVRVPEEVPDIEERDDESTRRKKQLERMANENPEDFAKLLRSWISED